MRGKLKEKQEKRKKTLKRGKNTHSKGRSSSGR